MNPNQNQPKNPNTCGNEPMVSAQKQDDLQQSIDSTQAHLKQLEDFCTLREAARPLINYLRLHHPHTFAIVDGERVKIAEDVKAVSL